MRLLAPSTVGPRRRRVRRATFVLLMAVLAGIILAYSLLFQVFMQAEGRPYSWVAGLYWAIQTMSTLGYGDIIFESDAGRLFAVLVLLTGITILFIFLPFTLIQFFYAPWLEARAASRAPRSLPATMAHHVILTAHGPIETALIERLDQFRTPYAVIVADVPQALALHDQGVEVMVGRLDDVETYRRAQVDQAALVATTLGDATNANVVLTVRQISATVPIVATAAWENSAALLRQAGCADVIQLGDMLGRAIAVRIAGQDGQTRVVGNLDGLLVAEASAARTPLVGHTLGQLRLRERLGVTVAGVWQRGRYLVGTPEVVIDQESVLLLSGSASELAAYDREIPAHGQKPEHAVIIGGGRVGRATARALVEFGIEYVIVELNAERVRDASRLVRGDATNPDVLAQAGVARASSVAVTTREDDVNVYVTLECRQMRPDIQILSRATHERNVATLYQAGADVVLSYFPMEANAIFGVLHRGNLLLLAEGLDLFTVDVPAPLAGRTIADSRLRQRTGCNVLAVRPKGGTAQPADPSVPLPAGAQMILLGDGPAARKYFELYR